MRSLTIAIVFSGATASAQPIDPPIIGADLSSLNLVEDGGAVFSDGQQPADPIAVLTAAGVNTVRLRLWVNPAGPYSALPDVISLAQRAKAAGLRVLLDPHYSDFWADPGNQTPPVSWQGLDLAQLEQRVREHTRDALNALNDADAPADFIQLGNEITNGMLWPTGRVSPFDDANWDALGALLRAARAGVDDADGPAPRVMLHVDRGGDLAACGAFFQRAIDRGVEFDTLAVSFYPWWHGRLHELRWNVAELERRFSRPVCIVETAYPFTTGFGDNTGNVWGPGNGTEPAFDATPDGQALFYHAIANIGLRTPASLGGGYALWEPAWIPAPNVTAPWTAGSPVENLAVFGFDGSPLPALGALRGGFGVGNTIDGVWIGGEGTPSDPVYPPAAKGRAVQSGEGALDAVFVRRAGDSVVFSVRCTLPGNATGVALLIDTDPGGANGQAVLDLTGSGVPGGLGSLQGLALGGSFRPDRLYFVNHFQGAAYADRIELTPGASVGTYLGLATEGTGLSPLTGGSAGGHGLAFAGEAAALDDRPGFELRAPLASLGLGPGVRHEVAVAALLILPGGTAPVALPTPALAAVTIPLLEGADTDGSGAVDTEDLYHQERAPADLNADGTADALDTRDLETLLRLAGD